MTKNVFGNSVLFSGITYELVPNGDWVSPVCVSYGVTLSSIRNLLRLKDLVEIQRIGMLEISYSRQASSPTPLKISIASMVFLSAG